VVAVTLIATQMGYYAAAAQVIPVLMLVSLVGESRFFKTDGDARGFGVAFPLFAMFVLLVGELAALRTLGQGHDSSLLWGLTTGGLTYGLVFVFQSALRSFLLEDLAGVSKARREGLRRLHLIAGLGSVLVAAIVLIPSY
jgi:hypothetical protein